MITKIDYLHYLMTQVDAGREYAKLCKKLLDTPFDYNQNFVMDRNRASDGLDIRASYVKETGGIPNGVGSDCSVLEMLVALSIRIDLDIMGEPGELDASRWFFLMLCNLGLDDMTNNRFDPQAVDAVTYDLMNHTYKQNGEGSLFPLSRHRGDQRNLSIWEQMNEYMVENY